MWCTPIHARIATDTIAAAATSSGAVALRESRDSWRASDARHEFPSGSAVRLPSAAAPHSDARDRTTAPVDDRDQLRRRARRESMSGCTGA
jgi:hypothetical protein